MNVYLPAPTAPSPQDTKHDRKANRRIATSMHILQQYVRLAGSWWLVLICTERKVILTDCWFVLREKYCWLVADNPNEDDRSAKRGILRISRPVQCRQGRRRIWVVGCFAEAVSHGLQLGSSGCCFPRVGSSRERCPAGHSSWT
jgi:hypothetical protein